MAINASFSIELENSPFIHHASTISIWMDALFGDDYWWCFFLFIIRVDLIVFQAVRAL